MLQRSRSLKRLPWIGLECSVQTCNAKYPTKRLTPEILDRNLGLSSDPGGY